MKRRIAIVLLLVAAMVSVAELAVRRALPADHETPYVFRGCVFRDASVAGLDLSGATFGHCVFDEADFTGTHLDDTMWRGVQGMRQCVGGIISTLDRRTSSNVKSRRWNSASESMTRPTKASPRTSTG